MNTARRAERIHYHYPCTCTFCTTNETAVSALNRLLDAIGYGHARTLDDALDVIEEALKDGQERQLEAFRERRQATP